MLVCGMVTLVCATLTTAFTTDYSLHKKQILKVVQT